MTWEHALDKAAKKHVLFLGETIYDIYHYGRLLARPLKEPIVCIEHASTESFQGGVVAASKHAAGFCKRVDTASAVVISKERFVEQAKTRKLFEVYGQIARLPAPQWPSLRDYEVVAVTDYGHGMMTPQMIESVCHDAPFLAVNVQANAGNYGFNLATKYPKANYLCVDELEARLATQNQHGPIEQSLEALSRIAPRVAITLGKEGAIGTGNVRVPAFEGRVLDTMGAGDAFFAITACIAEETPMRELLTIGNAAGKLKAGIVGHRSAVTKTELLNYLRSRT